MHTRFHVGMRWVSCHSLCAEHSQPAGRPCRNSSRCCGRTSNGLLMTAPLRGSGTRQCRPVSPRANLSPARELGSHEDRAQASSAEALSRSSVRGRTPQRARRSSIATAHRRQHTCQYKACCPVTKYDGEDKVDGPRVVSRCGSIESILQRSWQVGPRGAFAVFGQAGNSLGHCGLPLGQTHVRMPIQRLPVRLPDDSGPHQQGARSFPKSQPDGASAPRARPQPRAPMAGRRTRRCAPSAHRWRKELC
jgi:hypothetical protein